MWHGASWTFVAWGAYHGLLLSVYRAWGHLWDRQPALLQRAFMFLLTIVGWVFFRAANWNDATMLFRKMFLPVEGLPVTGGAVLLVMIVIAGVVAHTFRNTSEIRHEWNPVDVSGFALLVVLCLILMYGDQVSPFLYFQF